MGPSGGLTIGSPATSYDLAGYVPGLEICIGTHTISLDGPLNGTVNLLFGYYNPSGNLLGSCWNTWTFDVNIASGDTWTYVNYGLMNTGCAFWEIAQSATYSFRTYLTGAITLSKTTNLTFSNVPSTTQLDPSYAGHIWVDGNYLAIVNANQWVHRILGTDQGYVGGTPGYIWMDTSSNISWISEDGHKRTAPWKIKQFASWFFNGPTGERYAGTDKAGTIWMDYEFGRTHLAYIGYDGYKYLCGAGDYPY
jgi:hypothetical protein